MPRMTQAEVDAHQMRVNAQRRSPDAATNGFDGKEADLHRLIEMDLKSRRWLYVHSRTDQPTTTQKGVPDFIVFSGLGKVLFVEVKTRTGKLSTEQRVWQYCAEIAGYEYHIVRSLSEWMQLITP